jgi:hypothetical protein
LAIAHYICQIAGGRRRVVSLLSYPHCHYTNILLERFCNMAQAKDIELNVQVSPDKHEIWAVQSSDTPSPKESWIENPESHSLQVCQLIVNALRSC